MDYLSDLVRRMKRTSIKRSGPLPSNFQETSGAREPSSAGLFGKLPFEIRHIIYTYALGGDLLHLTHTAVQKEVGYHACQESQPYFHHYHTVGRPLPSHRLCLLKTSRQIYIEASPVLYGTNTFGIFGAHNLPVFCEFARTIRKECLAAITSIYINCQADGCVSNEWTTSYSAGHAMAFLQNWTQAWELISTQMPALKDLKVQLIKTHYPPLELSLEDDWVISMLEVQGLRTFEFDLTQEIGAYESTAEYNEKLEWFQEKLRESMCSS